MDRILENLIDRLIRDNQHQKAIDTLMPEYELAHKRGNRAEVDSVLSHLFVACCSSNPPQLEKARFFSLEREKNIRSAHNMLQTGMFLCYTANDYIGAVNKLKQAITAGKLERDTRTIYSSFGVLGVALLRQGFKEEAIAVLTEIEQAIAHKTKCVIGDETTFLEVAREHGLEPQRVKKLAGTLAPMCREPQFAERLTALASDAS